MLLIVSACCAAYLILLGVKLILAVVQTRNDRATTADALKPETLTILQPILSGDVRLEEMLESNLLSLPEQRFLWLCDAWDVEGIRVAERLREKYPTCQITIQQCPDCPDRVNPKVFKLIHGSSLVDTPFFAVVDDDTHLPTVTAIDLVAHARVGMVATALPVYRASGGFSGALLAQFVNNNSAVTYLSLLPFCRPISINGMCYVMKHSDIGIFHRIPHHLTDDLALAGAVKEAGGTIYQSSRAVFLTTDIAGFRHYWRMMHRWYLFALLLLREQGMGYQFVIFALHGWHPLMLWIALIALVIQPSWAVVLVLAAMVVIRTFLLRMLQKEVFGKPVHQSTASIISELLQPLHLLHAFTNRNIRWRNRRYRVYSSDHFETNE